MEAASFADKFPGLLQFEHEMRSKVGPLSIQKPLKDRVKDIVAYYTGVAEHHDVVPMEAGVRELLSEFKAIKGLRLKHPFNVWDDMKHNTNSGSPEFTKRGNIPYRKLHRLVERLYHDGDLTGTVAVLG